MHFSAKDFGTVRTFRKASIFFMRPRLQLRGCHNLVVNQKFNFLSPFSLPRTPISQRLLPGEEGIFDITLLNALYNNNITILFVVGIGNFVHLVPGEGIEPSMLMGVSTIIGACPLYTVSILPRLPITPSRHLA